MKNLKFNILLLMLLTLFACDVQQMAEDQTPEINNSSTLKHDPITPGDKSGNMMIITVQYPLGWDRAAERASIGAAIGLTSWSPCQRPDAETWIVDFMTEAQLFAILDNFNVSKVSAGSSGTSDPWAKDPDRPVFFYDNLCQ